MAAATLQTKKTVNKGKIKRSLKNVLCRPDPVFWPSVSNNEKTLLEAALSKHKVDIPEFTKPQWKDLKMIPKDKRPKPPKIKKIEGMYFGISECCNAIKNSSCGAVVVESSVNPRAIVQPVIEACINSRVPMICVDGLKIISASNFGIPTSCLGIKCDCLLDLSTQVLDIAKNYKLPQIPITVKSECIPEGTQISQDEPKCLSVKDMVKLDESTSITQPVPTVCPYLYRTSKKTRVFNPSEGALGDKFNTKFSGQDYIEFTGKKGPSDAGNADRKSYMKMILKKISNNPKRVYRFGTGSQKL